MYLISQVFAFLSFLLSLLAYHMKKRKQIMLFMVMSNTLNSLHYFFLNSYSACLVKIIAIMRDSFMIVKDNHKKLDKKIFLFLFLLVYSTVTLLTFKNAASVFPFLAATLYLVVIWDGKELDIKRISYQTYIFWLIYNICVLSIVGICASTISTISSYIAYRNQKNICHLK